MGRRPRASLSPSVIREPDRELTVKQRAFVDHYLANGGQLREAAESAGYPPAGAAVMASRLIRNPVIQQHLTKQMIQTIGLHAVGALHTVKQLADGAHSEYVRLEASKDLLNRAGYAPPDRLQALIDGNLTVSIDLGGVKTVEGSRGHSPSDATIPQKVRTTTHE